MSSMSGDEASGCLKNSVIHLRWLPLAVGLCMVASVSWGVSILPAWAATETAPSVHVVTGVLAMVDVSTGKGMIKTDLDKPIFFQIGRPEQFTRLSIGDRVTIQLDGDGRSLKVIEALPSEVHEPPPPSR